MMAAGRATASPIEIEAARRSGHAMGSFAKLPNE
jgi:hypothetical protein